MIYTDGIHLVCSDLKQLHKFCKRWGIKRCWYEGYRKGHPHYDIPNYKVGLINELIYNEDIMWTSSKHILVISKRSMPENYRLKLLKS